MGTTVYHFFHGVFAGLFCLQISELPSLRFMNPVELLQDSVTLLGTCFPGFNETFKVI